MSKLVSSKSGLACVLLVAALTMLAMSPVVRCQRNNNNDDNDSFDDEGFDDTGYNSPNNHEAEGSHQNPNTYSPNSDEDLDDDDDADETSMAPQVAPSYDEDAAAARNHHSYHNQLPQPSVAMESDALPAPQGRPQRFYDSAASVVLANVGPEPPQAFNPLLQRRYRRSIEDSMDAESSNKPLLRVRRYSKHYIGPVYTFVKTDKHARFKWGVKHKVGKHHG